MEHVTQAEVEGFIAEACRTYPTLHPSDAVMRLALEEARAACERLDLADHAVRHGGGRKFRDQKI